ncbi:unnamed protein product [Durusdinium trenchii]|uniref:Uncharacterized protein n=1 Tax=Durusdinium trenchii TaxID=1381693 RepID=A0ABP0SK69_9DINO
MLLSLNPSCPSFKAPIFRKTEQSVVQQLSTCTELPLSASAMTDVQSEAEPLVEKVMPGWMEEIEETLVLSQQESEESALADACRISSDEESIDEESAAMTVPCSPQTSDEWWVFRLKSATQDLGGDFAQLKTLQPVLLGSSCSGACSEAAAFTALGIPFQLCGVADVNKDFRQIIEANYKPSHSWSLMQDQISCQACLKHADSMACEMASCLDVWVSGTPCPPFSEQRPRRFNVGSVEAHPLYSVTFESAIDAVKQGHKAYIFEQVKGFGKPYDMSTSETPLERLLGFSTTYDWERCCGPACHGLGAGFSSMA